MKVSHALRLPLLCCLLAADTSPAQNATHVIMVNADGEHRSVQLHIPAGYDGEKPLPLVFNLHGTGGAAERQELLSGMSAVADEHEFLVAGGMAVYEFPDGRMAGRKSWNVSSDPDAVDDLAYIRAAIDAIDRKSPVDRQRVYVMGHSGGARMASRLACDLSDVIAAAGMVAGMQFPDDCQPSRPVPVIAFHGVQDPLNLYAEAADPERNSFWVAGAIESAGRWAAHNDCGLAPGETPVSEVVTRLAWPDCAADVVLYRIENGGHSWPGSPIADRIPERAGITNMDVDASRLMWAFFAANPLR